jgi:hypothetical protein
MKHFLIVAALVTIAVPALASDVGVSVSIGQPGFYGQIDIGNYPQPRLIYPAPVMVQPMPIGMVPQPIYLRAPPGPSEKLAQTLPQIWRLWPASLFCSR